MLNSTYLVLHNSASFRQKGEGAILKFTKANAAFVIGAVILLAVGIVGYLSLPQLLFKNNITKTLKIIFTLPDNITNALYTSRGDNLSDYEAYATPTPIKENVLPYFSENGLIRFMRLWYPISGLCAGTNWVGTAESIKITNYHDENKTYDFNLSLTLKCGSKTLPPIIVEGESRHNKMGKIDYLIFSEETEQALLEAVKTVSSVAE